MRNTLRRDTADNGVRANGNTNTTHYDHGEDVSDRRRLIGASRSMAEGATSTRLPRDVVDALEAQYTATRERLAGVPEYERLVAEAAEEAEFFPDQYMSRNMLALYVEIETPWRP